MLKNEVLKVLKILRRVIKKGYICVLKLKPNIMDEWINQRVRMIAEGFSLEQIQRECWDYCHRECLGILNLDATICRAMQLYAEVIKRSGVTHNGCGMVSKATRTASDEPQM